MYEHGGYLSHVTTIILTQFHFLAPKRLHKNGPVVSGKKEVLILICKCHWDKVKK